VSAELGYLLGRTPTVEEVAQELGVARESWPLLKRTIESNGSGSLLSLDLLSENQDTVPDDRSEDPEESYTQRELLRHMAKLLDGIDEREATILRLRYGLEDSSGDPMTLKEIGKIVGLTRERVRQIEVEALRKLHVIMDAA
jgi:RNA polymerase primary sigma factor